MAQLIEVKGVFRRHDMLNTRMNGYRRRISGFGVVCGNAFFLAMAVAALAIMMLKPLCDIHTAFAAGWHAHAHAAAQTAGAPAHALGAETVPCCQSVDTSSIAKLADTAAIAWPGSSPAPLAAVLFVLGAISIARRRVPIAAGRPPGQQDFYARSARILR